MLCFISYLMYLTKCFSVLSDEYLDRFYGIKRSIFNSRFIVQPLQELGCLFSFSMRFDAGVAYINCLMNMYC